MKPLPPGVYPPRGRPEARLRRILARRKRKLDGPWPVRLWRRLLGKLKRRAEAKGDQWPRWYAPPTGNEPATPAAIRAQKLRAQHDELIGQANRVHSEVQRRWGLKP